MFRFILSPLLALGIFTGVAAAEMQLVMGEERGCMWCARWDAEIAPIYPKTPEGKRAPLRRVNIHAALPEDISLDRSIRFTPTFVLMVNGAEVSRIEGYPGEDFFWGLLGMMIETADKEPGDG